MTIHLWQARVTQLGRDKRGTVAILFAASVIPILLCVGLAIDGARGYYTASKTSAVLDAAALAAAKAMSEREISDAEVRDIAIATVKAHMAAETPRGITAASPVVTIDRENDTVSVALTSHVDTFFAGLAGFPKWEVNKAASAVYGQRDIELGLMLDVSGSMEDFGKIDDLKVAAADLVKALIPEAAEKRSVKIGLAPYSWSVNAGDYAERVRDDDSSGPGGGKGKGHEKCVSERKGGSAFTDDSPGKGKKLGGKPSACPVNEILAISSSRSELLEKLAGLSAAGSTAGHLGIAWAWYLVSPNWADIWPSESQPKPYGDRKVMKVVILMTDGMFNTRYEADNGDSAEQARRLCDNIKATGI
ncbi:MAG TPA: pilus assembly protein, partial [Hyphomicrobiaceae bacterium]|nr:pilus assembly protein [Hyphomicrobiaceae bacterium]